VIDFEVVIGADKVVWNYLTSGRKSRIF